MRLNILYLIVFSSALTGCGGKSLRPAPADEAFARAVQIEERSSRDRADESRTSPRRTQAPRARRTEALLQALLALDIDYRNGGSSPVLGFDCSGLVAHVYREAYGISLPRNTRAQSEVGTPVALHELQPGDLVFYNTLDRPYSHVGIYLGDGRFIHAPKSGARVRIESVRASYWANRFDGGRRIADI